MSIFFRHQIKYLLKLEVFTVFTISTNIPYLIIYLYTIYNSKCPAVFKHCLLTGLHYKSTATYLISIAKVVVQNQLRKYKHIYICQSCTQCVQADPEPGSKCIVLGNQWTIANIMCIVEVWLPYKPELICKSWYWLFCAINNDDGNTTF